MILGADSSLGCRSETGIGAIVVHQLRVLQNEGPNPGRRFFCPLFVGNDNKRLKLSFRIGSLLSGGSQNGNFNCGILFSWSC